jgi:eukaryotic-like serine/threonine-protein kinase
VTGVPTVSSRPFADRYRIGHELGHRGVATCSSWRAARPRTLIESRFDHCAPTFSPDGHWLAYVSEESGVPDVYVRPFPNVDSARVAVSVGGGVDPVWSRDGTELFFRGPHGEMFAVPVTIGRRFTHGAPKVLFTIPGMLQDQYHRAYDVTPDGKRFLMVQSGGGDAAELSVIFNRRAELEGIEETPR